MQSTEILALVATAVAEREEMSAAPALIEVFAAIPDPRRRRGRRYPCCRACQWPTWMPRWRCGCAPA
jgi:hypothetical protein